MEDKKLDIEKRIIILQDDITNMQVDAIVNAANNDLILGSGVAGAIRRKGGPIIQKECSEIGRVPVGSAVITSGGNLPAKYVIHAASMQLGKSTTEKGLKYSVYNSLKLACNKELKTIAFPAIGLGIGGFPKKKGAKIILSVILDFMQNNLDNCSLQKVYVVLFNEDMYELFKDVFGQLCCKEEE